MGIIGAKMWHNQPHDADFLSKLPHSFIQTLSAKNFNSHILTTESTLIPVSINMVNTSIGLYIPY